MDKIPNIPLILNPYVTRSTRLVSIRVELAICNNISYTSFWPFMWAIWPNPNSVLFFGHINN